MDILFYLEFSVSSFLLTFDPLGEVTSAQPIMTFQSPLGLACCLYTGVHVISQTDLKNLQGKVYTVLYSCNDYLIYQPPLLSFFFFFNFWLRWVFVAARGLSLVAASGGYSSL